MGNGNFYLPCLRNPGQIKMKELFLGKSDIDEINKELKMDIPELKGYHTFSGFILDQIERIPHKNE